MTRSEAWLLHAAGALVGGSGLVYAWMLYLARPADEFALVNHPLQPTFQHLHVVTAPLLVFGVGLVWRQHVWVRLRSGFRPRRASGLALALSFAPMVASGYLLQTAVGETWRWVWLVVHLVASGLWVAAYVVHQLSARGPRRRGRGASAAAASAPSSGSPGAAGSASSAGPQ